MARVAGQSKPKPRPKSVEVPPRPTHERCYDNILYPSTKIQCDVCKGDISKFAKITQEDTDYCVACFAQLVRFGRPYSVANKLDFALFTPEWSADEELLLFEGLQKNGYGNWNDIAEHIGTNKTPEDVQNHYEKVYLNERDFLPSRPCISQRDGRGFLTTKGPASPVKRQMKSHLRQAQPVVQQHAHRGALTVHHRVVPDNATPAEIVGYMPKRGDFEVEYDNDAELLLAEMEFNDEDTPEERAMKFRVMDIYNEKLSERIRRKKFVVDRKLLDLREQVRLDKTRSKEEKEMYNMMKVFARFTNLEEHEALVQGLIKQRQLAKEIEELKELRKKGIRSMNEANQQLECKKRKEDKLRKREVEYLADKSKMRRMRKQHAGDKQRRPPFEDRAEEAMFMRLGLSYRHYIIVKETLTREATMVRKMTKQHAKELFCIDWYLLDPIYDYLVDNGIIDEEVQN